MRSHGVPDVLHHRRIKNDNGQTAKIGDIESKQMRNAITLHGRNQANVVGAKACHAVGFNQRLPEVREVRAVVKQ